MTHSNTFIVTNAFKYRNVKSVVDAVANGDWYFFVGDHLPHSNSTLQNANDTSQGVSYDPYNKMIMGKRFANNDVIAIVRNIPWEEKAFAMYDDIDDDLILKDFYTMIEEGSYTHVWKCLDNNNNANSTIAPDFASGANTLFYQTSDGYRWKYLTSMDSNTVSKFASTKYFPISANTEVANNALAGRIVVVKIDANQYGAGYGNYLDGTLRAADILVNGDPTLYNISNSSVQTTNGYYTGFILYLSSGVGQGQFRTVTDFVANSTGNLVRLDLPFVTIPVNGTTFQVRPQVLITGDGTQTQNAIARGLVNALSTNNIYRVEMLQYGQGYTGASATVIANSVVGVSPVNQAIVRPIISPRNGHGADIFNELYCRDVEFGITLANNENNTLPTSNMYQQIGILRYPLFQDVELTFAAVTGNFTSGETIYQCTPVQLNTNCTANVSNNQISSNNASWVKQVAANDYILISTADSLLYQLRRVAAVVNSSVINVTSNSAFSCTQAIVYAANISSNMVCSSVTNTSVITATNVKPKIIVGTQLIGNTSGAYASILTVKRNNVTKFFDTFVELYKYTATMVSGTFTENEVINQGSNYGYVHHVEGTTTVDLFVSGMSQIFVANSTQVVGNTSGAIATLTIAYDKEVIPQSGQICYLENVDPITRQNTQSEKFQIIINF